MISSTKPKRMAPSAILKASVAKHLGVASSAGPYILGDPGADSGDEEKSKRAEKYMVRRKIKNGEKSPWGQSLTRPVPNGRRRSGIGARKHVVPRGSSRRSLFFFVPYIFPPVQTFPRPHYLPLGLRGWFQTELDSSQSCYHYK